MVVWAIADRFLDIIGMGTCLYWCFKLARWLYRPKNTVTAPRPRAERL